VDMVVTVFGCTGFLGRLSRFKTWLISFAHFRFIAISVVAVYRSNGTQVVIPYREEDDKRHLKPMGDLGSDSANGCAFHFVPGGNSVSHQYS